MRFGDGISERIMGSMILAKIKIAVAMMMIVSAVVIVAGSLGYQVLAGKPGDKAQLPAQVNQDVKQSKAEKGKVPAAQEAVTAKNEDEGSKRYSAVGKVVDNKGKAVPGATVYLREQPLGWTEGWTEQTKNIAQVVTDQQGEFKFEAVKLPHSVVFGDAAYPLDIIVVAKGHALAWKHGFEQDGSHSFSFAMQPEAAIRGRVLDREGNPVSKLAVRALQIMGLTDGPRPRRGNRRFFFD
ncbi:MAG TPA: carboxypeptidase-like regulatory domain-containing protein, partial [Gemmataceae bacterium]|nr:carboxypeptidase-like regulatory domain-containing protein [Gemmataceae bacterium]